MPAPTEKQFECQQRVSGERISSEHYLKRSSHHLLLFLMHGSRVKELALLTCMYCLPTLPTYWLSLKLFTGNEHFLKEVIVLLTIVSGGKCVEAWLGYRLVKLTKHFFAIDIL